MPSSFAIGDFSRATHLTVKMLRHYHFNMDAEQDLYLWFHRGMRMRSDKTVIRGAAALLIGVASGLASAQTLPATPASLAAADGQLETIVVTASKRSESQQDVASQMTALTGAEGHRC